MANSKRRCSQCKEYKIATDGILVNNTFFCDVSCAVKKGKSGIVKVQRKINKANKKAVVDLNRKSLAWQHKQTQPVFNRLRRLQEFKWFSDRGLEPICTSCGNELGEDQWCNGHFKSVGANGRLRYDFKNSYLQHNNNCNKHLSGDAKRYESGLINRFGKGEGESIIKYCEENNSPIKRTWQELELLRKEFNKQIKELQNES